MRRHLPVEVTRDTSVVVGVAAFCGFTPQGTVEQPYSCCTASLEGTALMHDCFSYLRKRKSTCGVQTDDTPNFLPTLSLQAHEGKESRPRVSTHTHTHTHARGVMLSACGVTGYWATDAFDGASLSANLKTVPEDFVVIEVDPSGQRTDAATYTHVTCSDATASKEPGDSPDDVLDDGPSPTPSVDAPALITMLEAALQASHCTLDEIAERSEKITAAEVLQLIEATKAGAKADLPCLCANDISLSSAFNREQRRLVHSVVRARYLHVRSRTRALDNDTNAKDDVETTAQEVYAFVDPHFVFFTRILGRRVAEQIAVWSQRHAASAWTEEAAAMVASLVDSHGSPPSPSPAVVDAMPAAICPNDFHNAISEKDIRRHVHELMRRFYPFLRCTVTDGKMLLRYQPRLLQKGAQPSAVGGDRREDKPHREYTYFVIKKHNMDTLELRMVLADHFRVREGSVGIAGMKDKRGITWQRVSIPGHHVRPAGTAAWTLPSPSDPRHSYLEICHTAPQPCVLPLQVGQLKGNHFIIRLRGIKAAAATTPTSDMNVREIFMGRFQTVVSQGFINYFGQQRFSESITDLHDHTGLHLFAGRWCAAVKSLYRGMPEVFEAFPEHMEARYVPSNSRDAIAMTDALRRTYRMYFSEHPLRKEDITSSSPLWQRVCETAVCDGVAFALRALWVHAGQSLFFNVAATHAAAHLLRTGQKSLGPQVRLPMLGYLRDATAANCNAGEVRAVYDAAVAHALDALRLSPDRIFQVRKVAGVPVPGSLRSLVVVPMGATMEWMEDMENTSGATVSFYLPSSSYATVCLREVLRTEVWW